MKTAIPKRNQSSNTTIQVFKPELIISQAINFSFKERKKSIFYKSHLNQNQSINQSIKEREKI